MKKLFFIFLLVSSNISISQSLSIGLGYQFQYAPEWNTAIQTYNFTRPWLQKKQPLLENGMIVNVDYLFDSEKILKHGISGVYSYYRSYSVNPDFISAINQHGINIAYIMRLDGPTMKSFFVDFKFSYAMTFLDRSVNKEAVTVDGKKLVAVGFGGNFDFKFGYKLPLTSSSSFAPFLGVGIGGMYNYKAESVLNQTTGITSSPTTLIFVASVGIQIKLNFSK